MPIDKIMIEGTSLQTLPWLIIRDYYEQFYANVLDKFDEKEKFLERQIIKSN